jgi:hypothetical protein
MKNGQQRYNSSICGGGTSKDGDLKLGAFVELMNVMNQTNFSLFLMNIFWARGVSKMRIYL